MTHLETLVDFTLEPVPDGTRLRMVESGFAQAAADVARSATRPTVRDGTRSSSTWRPTSMRPPDTAQAWLARLANRWDGRLAALEGALDATDTNQGVTRQ